MKILITERKLNKALIWFLGQHNFTTPEIYPSLLAIMITTQSDCISEALKVWHKELY